MLEMLLPACISLAGALGGQCRKWEGHHDCPLVFISHTPQSSSAGDGERLWGCENGLSGKEGPLKSSKQGFRLQIRELKLIGRGSVLSKATCPRLKTNSFDFLGLVPHKSQERMVKKCSKWLLGLCSYRLNSGV